jgi:hypothetical protein
MSQWLRIEPRDVAQAEVLVLHWCHVLERSADADARGCHAWWLRQAVLLPVLTDLSHLK